MTKWGKIRIKTAEGFGVRHRKPEYDDVSRAAEMYGVSYQRVQEDVLRTEDSARTEAVRLRASEDAGRDDGGE